MNKNILKIIAAIAFVAQMAVAQTNITSEFTDPNFLSVVRSTLGIGSNAPVYKEDVEKITVLEASFSGITSLTGIEYFIALEYLDVWGNQLTEIDASKNTALTYLDLDENQLTSVDVSKNIALTYLILSNNQLSSIDLSKNTALEWLGVWENQLTELDLSNNTELIELHASNNQLTSINVSKNTALEWLNVRDNQLSSIDVSKNTALIALSVTDNQLTELDVSKNTALEELYVDFNQLTELDVSKNIALIKLGVWNNQLTSLNVSNNTALIELDAYGNQLTSIDLSKNTALEWLDVAQNRLTTLNVSGLNNLDFLHCKYNYLSGVIGYSGDIGVQHALGFVAATRLNNLPNSAVVGTPLTLTGTVFPSNATNKTIIEWGIDEDDDNNVEASINGGVFTAKKPGSVLLYVIVRNGSAVDIDLEHYFLVHVKAKTDITNKFTDPNFLSVVRYALGIGDNDPVYKEDVEKITELEASFSGIISLAGIEYFTALEYLDVWGNQLTEIDVSKNTALTYLDLDFNQLTELDVSKNTALKVLGVSYNQLSAIDVSKNTALEWFYIQNNQLTELNVSGLNYLDELYCGYNYLSEVIGWNGDIGFQHTTPIFANQENPLIKGIMVQTIGNAIMLSNLPANAKVEVYNLQGKLVHNYQPTAVHQRNAKREGSSQLIINVQTKGMYVIKINNQALRVVVK
jgi:Leucine-rich repeat (LRR) protein